MLKGYAIIDADGHVMEPADLWERRLPPALAAALARAYNDWIHEFVGADPARLRPVAGLSLHDPAAARAEAERVAALGFRAVYVRPNPLRGRLLGDAAYAPLWEACEALDL